MCIRACHPADDDLSALVRWLTVTQTQRCHAHYDSASTGPLYQDRLESFPVEEDDHLGTVYRYVERNPLRAGLVGRPARAVWLPYVNDPGTEAE